MANTPPQIMPIRLMSLPGIKRDGTVLEGDYYVDGTWSRFQRGLPRSMGGYRRLTNLLTGIGRGMNVFSLDMETYTHIGYSATIQQMQIDPNGVVSGIVDRTPAGFVTSANNLWTFDQVFDTSDTNVVLVACATPSLADISNDTAALVYYGIINATTALITTGATPVSGGVAVFQPYTFAFGSGGVVYWSVPGNPTDWSGTGSGNARVTAQKVVAALPLRAGAGNAPSGLFWTLNTLVRCTFIGSPAFFQFDTLTCQSSILSQQGIIEYDGVYFWAGVDRFLLYNGVVSELPNNMNINYFFDNLNYTWRQKVFAYKVPRYGEIWWCYPANGATECTNAIIYNVRENCWYDTVLPNSGRSCGQFAQVFDDPLMCGVDFDSTAAEGGYRLWQHEFGNDEIDGQRVRAIYKAIESGTFGMPASTNPNFPGGTNQSIICNSVETDFVQSGNMDMIVKTGWNARSPENISSPYSFPATAATPDQQTLTIRETGRYMRFRFESNTQGGAYQMGKCLAQIQIGDERFRS